MRGSLASSGTIRVDAGTLSLFGPTATLAGTLAGAGELDLRGGGQYQFAGGIAVAVATLGVMDIGSALSLGAGLAYSGGFTLGGGASIALSGASVALSGQASLDGTIIGPGTVSASGSADANGLTLAGGAALDDRGVFTQAGPVTLGGSYGDPATLTVEGGATYDLISDDSVFGLGAASIANAGLFEKTGVGGLSSVSAQLSNTGTIAVGRGTLAFSGALTNDGAIVVGGSGAPADLIIGTALLAGSGTIRIGAGATLAVDSAAAAGESIAFAGAGGLLALAEPGAVAGTISGFATGDTIDLVGIAANRFSYANGVLELTEISAGTTAIIAGLHLPGIADPAGLALMADGTGGTAIEFATADPPPNITLDNWTAGGGDWSNAANWTKAGGAHAVPGINNDAVIAPAGTAGFVVGYTASGSVAQLTGGTLSSGAAITLAIGGGALTVGDGGFWSGSLVESAGTFDAAAGFSILGTASLGSAAVAEIDSSTLAIGGGTLGGTIRGAGELKLLAPGQFALAPGLSLAVATLDLAASAGNGATATLQSSVSYAGKLVLEVTGATRAALVLNGNSLGLGGSAFLDGTVIGTGTIGVTGAADLDGLVLSGSVHLTDRGTLTQDGPVTLGTAASDASVLRITAGATYNILADVDLASGAAAAILNAGVFEKTGLNGASTIGAGFTNTGTIAVASGKVALAGANTGIGGSVMGAGTLLLAGSATLRPGVSLTIGTLAVGAAGGPPGSAVLGADIGYGGHFLLARGAGTLHLAGKSLALSGAALLDGAIDNAGSSTPGALVVSGSADANGLVLTGPAELLDTGTITQDGALALDPAASVVIAAGATYDILAGIGIAGTGAAALTNSGLFEKTGALGASTIDANFANSGTILAARGTIALAGGANDTLGGTLTGAGAIDLEPSGTATLANGVVLSVATLALGGGNVALGGSESYAGRFILAPAAILTPNGFALTLSGTATLAGELNGGLVTILGTAQANGLILAGGGTLDDARLIAQDGMVTLGTAASDTPTIVIDPGATYDILTDVNINSHADAAIANRGLFEKSGANGISYVFADIANTGTIAVAEGTLALRAGTADLGGRITGAGALALDSAGIFTLDSGLTLDVAALGLYGGGNILLESSRSYTGCATLGPATTLDLMGHVLSLDGIVGLDGVVAGAGTLAVQGSADANGLVLAGAAVLNVIGTIAQDGAVTLGTGADMAQLNIETAATYDLIADVGLAANGNVGANNGGLFEKTAGSGTSMVATAVTNTGTIAATSGTLALTGSVVNDGLMRVAGGELVVGQSLGADAGHSGTIAIGAGGEVLLQGAVSSAQAIAFAGAPGILALAAPTSLAAAIGGFGHGDTIDLVGATFTSGADVVSFTNQVLAVSNAGTTIASLHLAGAYGAAEFQLADDGAHGTAITIPCFLAGTRILTPRGELPVEQLAVGELVLTQSGEAKPIVWIGRRSIACARHPVPQKVRPVRIRAGAFASDLPRRDLLLSPDHAVFANGVLIPVKHLINGISIRQENMDKSDYVHIELAGHDILLAEGLAVESYLDSGNRAEFASGSGRTPVARHPGSASNVDAMRFAPLCVSGPRLASVKRVLLSRLERDGWGVAVEPELHLIAAGRIIRPGSVSGCGRLYSFFLPDKSERIRIISHRGIPAEIDAESEDGRRLGVAIERIVLDGRAMPPGDPALGAGFHGIERQGAVAWRWTDGEATLMLPPGEPGKPRLLELAVCAIAPSWREPRSQSSRAA